MAYSTRVSPSGASVATAVLPPPRVVFGERERPQRRRRRRNALLLVGGALIATVIAVAVVGLFYTPYDPRAMAVAARGQGPSLAHLAGTDHFGRDILSRVMRGASVALLVGGAAVGLGLAGGVPLGALAALAGGWVDEALMRLMDGLFAFPATLLAIAIVGVLGPGLANTSIAIAVAYVPVFARLARAAVLAQLETGYVEAARAVGCRPGRVLWTHILPNGLGPVIVQATAAFGGAILAEAALSYLGLGVQPPDPSWGQMLAEARDYLSVAPWLAVLPGAAIALTVLGFNLLGDGLRDSLDPTRR